jgi:signal transduction histidine kinase
MFEPFVRGRDVTAPGHGLGLAIVRQVMDEHRGYVRIESAETGGTTFIVGLPRAG